MWRSVLDTGEACQYSYVVPNVAAKISYIRKTARIYRRYLTEQLGMSQSGAAGAMAAVESSLSSQLDQKNLIVVPRPLSDFVGPGFDLPLPDRYAAFGVDPPGGTRKQRADWVRHWRGVGYWEPSPAARLQAYLRQSADGQRAAAFEWRFGQEAERKRAAGWWPIFATLTIDPVAYNGRELMSDGSAWIPWRKGLAKIARGACGASSRVPEAEYFTYAAILEHGSSREHHHIHALCWLRGIPSGWTVDPNRGRQFPNATDILGGKSLWPYGYSKFEPFRSLGDIWSSVLGWQYPLVDGRPMTLWPDAKAGGYLCKYVSKGAAMKEWSHRMKTSHSLGLEGLRGWLHGCGLADLVRLSVRPPEELSDDEARRSRVPTGLVRREAQRLLCDRLMKTTGGRRRLLFLYRRPESEVWERMRGSVTVQGATPWSMDGDQTRRWLWKQVPAELPPGCGPKVAAAWRVVRDWSPKLAHMAVGPLSGVRP